MMLTMFREMLLLTIDDPSAAALAARTDALAAGHLAQLREVGLVTMDNRGCLPTRRGLLVADRVREDEDFERLRASEATRSLPPAQALALLADELEPAGGESGRRRQTG